MRSSNFTAKIDRYVVLKLALGDYTGSWRELAPGFDLLEPGFEGNFAADEQRLLKLYFHNWRAPYERRLYGYRDNSPIRVTRDHRLVAGIYLCDRNEFDDDASETVDTDSEDLFMEDDDLGLEEEEEEEEE